ncbi:hypothetical protein [Streptomyces sp. NPDC097640]|uniref:hypothetical protein n=1 Tax=Streptomyces sp. NPDC097640 TaxID=3157229 RepID=UPI0033318E9B
MTSEEFTARALIHRSVQKKATGMDREKVAEETEKARGWERQAGRGIDEPGRLDTLHHAEWKHTEWRRIGYVMTEQHMDTYNPQADPKVAQWEQARIQRAAATSSTGQGPAVGGDLRRYRVMARRQDPAHPGVLTITHFADAGSVEEAAQKVRSVHEREGGLYGIGLYRIVRVEEAQPDEGDELSRLKAFARQALAVTCPETMAWRRALEALAEAGGLCTASTLDADGDRVVCCREAGHYNPQEQPSNGGPGGWHRVGGVMWTDAGAAARPHQPA